VIPEVTESENTVVLDGEDVIVKSVSPEKAHPVRH
jgi:hypothetical protein